MGEASGWRVVVMHRGRSWTVPLPASGSVRIGRSADCEVQIDEPRVSRLHAVLTARGGSGGFLVEDQGSQNGTSLVAVDAATIGGTGRALEHRLAPHAPAEVSPGAMIHVGSAVLVISAAAAERPAAPPPGLVVRDPALLRLHQLVARLAASDLGVLLLGESGVGKEVVARRLHDLSPRTAGRFVGVNCGALAESLLESELFGHEKGAFTGASKAKPGLIEAASGGTLFLDEVGELSTGFQVKLLRVLEERQLMPVGGTETRTVDVRVVSATNRDLEAEVAAGRFRQDLYYRLNGISLVIPPLRERLDELEPLAGHFLERAAGRERRTPPRLGEAALAALRQYGWPGNIRELRNVIERSLVLCTGDELLPQHLGLRPGSLPPVETGADPAALRELADDEERRRIVEALDACAGNQTKAAERLGITRRMLVRRLEKYGLPRPRR